VSIFFFFSFFFFLTFRHFEAKNGWRYIGSALFLAFSKFVFRLLADIGAGGMILILVSGGGMGEWEKEEKRWGWF